VAARRDAELVGLPEENFGTSWGLPRRRLELAPSTGRTLQRFLSKMARVTSLLGVDSCAGRRARSFNVARVGGQGRPAAGRYDKIHSSM